MARRTMGFKDTLSSSQSLIPGLFLVLWTVVLNPKRADQRRNHAEYTA